MDNILTQAPGLYFGRFDIRVPNTDDFKNGKNLSILEMNGVTSEAAHIYDPDASIFNAWKTLCQQWSHAFKVSKKNLQNGAKTVTVKTILREYKKHKQVLSDLEKQTGTG